MLHNIVITGAASGLGLAFLEHYASLEPSSEIYALDVAAQPLHSIFKDPAVHYYQVDITDPSALANALSPLVTPQSPKPVNLLVHSAGIRGLVPSIPITKDEDVAQAETWQVMDKETVMRTFEINCYGTIALIQVLLPCLQQAARAPTKEDSSAATTNGDSKTSKPVVLVMGSRMGSISRNISLAAGGAYAYRASKAAQNAAMTSFAIDVPEVLFAIVHPGRVATGLVKGCREEGAIEPQESLTDMLAGVVRKIEQGGVRSGSYVDRWGGEIGW